MKKYLIGIMMMGVLLFALCGCGGTPLANAYDSLSDLAKANEGDDTYVEKPFDVQYDEENEVLIMDILNGTDLDPIFEALDKAIDGKDIGTLIFSLSGTKGDDYEQQLDQKLSELPCASMERLGLNYPILDYSGHKWLALADKTDKLYINTNCLVFGEYDDTASKALSKFKDVQIAHDDANMLLNGISKLSGIETLTFVPPYTIQHTAAEDPLAKVTEDNPYLNGEAGSENGETSSELLTDDSTTAETEAEGEEAAPTPVEFDYYVNTSEGAEDLGNLENLKTVLIFPETGYEPTAGGQTFIKILQYLDPTLQMNAPGKAGSDDLVAVSDIKTPDVTDEQAADILARFLKEDIEDVYKECDKYKKADGDAVLNGKSLIFYADPPMDKWSDKKVFTTSGSVQLLAPKKKGIQVPEAVGDYKTFVYIYPTYARTGIYTSGTKAYSQTLRVQVFDMENKVKYDAKSVGTEPAPQSFSYFAGSVPDKHSGEVNVEKAFDYLAKLKTK